MLKFTIRLSDLSDPAWSWDGRAWNSGGSRIEPLANPSVESFLVATGERSCLVIVRERDLHGRRHPTPRTLTDALAWPGDHVTLELTPQGITAHAGVFGTAPLYLTVSDATAAGSWNVTDLLGRFEPGKLVEAAVTRALLRTPVYSSTTLFNGVRRLTERAMAHLDTRGVEVSYPDPAEHVLAARETRGADVVAAFDEVLSYVIGRLPRPDQVVAELSGGADSANVALSAASRHGTIRTVGLVVDGDIGRAQARRRETLVRHLGAQDVAIPAAWHPPFALDGIRGRLQPHDPEAAFYREAFDAMRTAARDCAATLVYTGLGGDEISALHPHERTPDPASEPGAVTLPDWTGPVVRAVAGDDLAADAAPVSAVPIPTLNAFALHNPAYLDVGIWPVAPLAHPLVVRFAEQLPVEYRRGKRLLRERLRRAKLPERLVSPAEPENFLSLMDRGMREYGVAHLQRMLSESILVDGGYLDGQALRTATEDLERTGRYETRLFDAIALETGLRSLQ
ncbi:asparagine synthase [Myceligenerans pegani]|uniref:Asparagine synthase n=1 Tax=Myceligenerans pegani TaxID=2776917 RepID=A0ABR9MZ02_9MICO|nr:asparagine synthase [Myceligenerans sp. TRM 65318]MBE1876616.1 asparagine synthase [Myceligenerans sp. TRM 65318]MBE3018887.1 asparagine synthase [Myceligenerans sp. TRM 65318]